MKHLFVPYELAVKLKEKGFDEECLAFYMGKKLQICTYTFSDRNINSSFSTDVKLCSGPLYQQVIDWFDDKSIDIEKPIKCSLGYLPHVYQYKMCMWQGDYYKTKYEALTKAIEEALKLI
jgi:hypothetical protein